MINMCDIISNLISNKEIWYDYVICGFCSVCSVLLCSLYKLPAVGTPTFIMKGCFDAIFRLGSSGEPD